MIHSRPGFAPRHSDQVPAKLNDDMIPAINRKAPEPNTNLREAASVGELNLEARTRAAMAKLAGEHPPPENILVNPNPSEPPKVLEPGK